MEMGGIRKDHSEHQLLPKCIRARGAASGRPSARNFRRTCKRRRVRGKRSYGGLFRCLERACSLPLSRSFRSSQFNSQNFSPPERAGDLANSQLKLSQVRVLTSPPPSQPEHQLTSASLASLSLRSTPDTDRDRQH